MKILLVEDSIRVREILVKTLKKTLVDYDITEVDNISDTREIISVEKYDLAILDLNLTDGSGYDLIDELKKNENTTIIVFTNSVSTFIRTRCLESGADYFFNKAADFENLILTVESLQPVL